MAFAVVLTVKIALAAHRKVWLWLAILLVALFGFERLALYCKIMPFFGTLAGAILVLALLFAAKRFKFPY